MTNTPQTLILRRPDDWHVHLRDGAMLDAVIGHTAAQMGRAIVMPNLTPPVVDMAAASAYRDRIITARDKSGHKNFTPLMTCYLTDGSDPSEVIQGFERGIFAACKLYPANATTNSAHGVTDIKKLYTVLDVMQNIGMPLLIHGEVTDTDIDIFDREAVFIERTLRHVVADFPALKIVFEHITTADGVEFVKSAPDTVAATITPHHLEFNRNAMLVGGIKPHFYCLPVVKRETHRLALRAAATSGSPKFFLGTDSAPHAVGAKESDCGCAGLYNATHAIESYAKTFDEENALDKLEAFASLNGPKFYGLPVNEARIKLSKIPNTVPIEIPVDDTHVVPFHAGEKLAWRFDGVVE